MGPLYPRLLLSLLLFAVPLGAAEESGAVFGTVVDSGGYPLPRATIRLSHQAQERQYEVDTDVNGRFHVKDVAPGAYKITIGHQGFQQSITEIRVSAGVETDIGVQQLAFGQCNTPGGPICDVFGLSDSRGAGNAGQASGCQLQIGDSEVFRVAQLPGSPQAAALRGLLTDRKNLSEAVFYYGDRLRPALRVLLQDAQVGERAAGLLAFIAVPADVKAIIGSPPRPEKPAFANRWAYGVATSLLEPTSDEEWTF